MKKKLLIVNLIIFLVVPAMARQVKVLPLDIYSPAISRTQAENILKIIINRLKKYKKYRLMTPPNQNPLDMILDAGYMDLNAESLAGIGKARGADIVLYTEIKKEGDTFYLYLQKVKVADHKQIIAKGGIGMLEHPDKGIFIALNQVFGPIPPPPPKVTVVSFITRPPGAEIFLNNKFLDNTPLVTKLKPGIYKVKVTKPGYKDEVRTIKVKKGAPLEVDIRLQQILIPKTTVPPSQQRKRVEHEKHWYQTWWFWTSVGVVVAAGVTTGVVLGTHHGAGPTGSAEFFMDPSKAYNDFSVQGR